MTPHCLWSTAKYVGGYHGLLSGVTVRPGSVEPHSVVECLYACREGLDFGDLETLGSGMKVTPLSEAPCRRSVLRGAPLTLTLLGGLCISPLWPHCLK